MYKSGRNILIDKISTFALSKYSKYVLILIVCFDIQLNIVGEAQDETSNLERENVTMRWKLGPCTSLNSIESGATYQYGSVYTERCCLEPGRHTLVCYNDPPSRGWNDAYILINGHRYCDDFISYKSFQNVLVPGTNLNVFFNYLLNQLSITFAYEQELHPWRDIFCRYS